MKPALSWQSGKCLVLTVLASSALLGLGLAQVPSVSAQAGCTAVTLTSTLGSNPEQIDFRADATCPAGASPQYAYLIYTIGGTFLGATAWTGDSWDWAPGPSRPGGDHVTVWASTVPGNEQAKATLEVTVGGAGFCTGGTLQSTVSQVPDGGNVGFSAAAACPVGVYQLTHTGLFPWGKTP